jgi:hypothetical protein
MTPDEQLRRDLLEPPEPLIGMISRLQRSDHEIAAVVGLRLSRIYDAMTDLAADMLDVTEGE